MNSYSMTHTRAPRRLIVLRIMAALGASGA
jgi:hypothetical protein